MQNVEKRCYGETHSADCIRTIFNKMKLSWVESEQYIFDKFSIPDRDVPGRFNVTKLKQPGVYSQFLDEEIEYYGKYGSKLYPAVVINNQTFRGQLEVEAVMNAICAGFADAPAMCKRVLEDNNAEDGILIFDFDDDFVPVHHVVGVIIFTMMTVVCVLCMYRRHAKRQMKTQINVQIEDAVNQYLALSNKDTEAGDRA